MLGPSLQMKKKIESTPPPIPLGLLVSRATRGSWKVLSMVFYLSNRFTNPVMFGITLKSYFSSLLWHKFHEDIIMQT